MNVFTQIIVSGFLLNRFLTGFPNLKRKKQKTPKTYTNAQILDNDKYPNYFTVFAHVTDENNDMTPTPNFVAS